MAQIASLSLAVALRICMGDSLAIYRCASQIFASRAII